MSDQVITGEVCEFFWSSRRCQWTNNCPIIALNLGSEASDNEPSAPPTAMHTRGRRIKLGSDRTWPFSEENLLVTPHRSAAAVWTSVALNPSRRFGVVFDTPQGGQPFRRGC